MDTQVVQKYIHEAKAAGKSEELIKTELRGAGWSEVDIAQAFSLVRVSPISVPATAPAALSAQKSSRPRFLLWFLSIVLILFIIGAFTLFSIIKKAAPAGFADSIKAVNTLADTSKTIKPKSECDWSLVKKITKTELPNGEQSVYVVENGIPKKDGQDVGYEKFAFCTPGATAIIQAFRIFPGYNTEGRWFTAETSAPSNYKISVIEEGGSSYLIAEERNSGLLFTNGKDEEVVRITQQKFSLETGFLASFLEGSFPGSNIMPTKDIRELVPKQDLSGWEAVYE